jgi:hypothetical protein
VLAAPALNLTHFGNEWPSPSLDATTIPGSSLDMNPVEFSLRGSIILPVRTSTRHGIVMTNRDSGIGNDVAADPVKEIRAFPLVSTPIKKPHTSSPPQSRQHIRGASDDAVIRDHGSSNRSDTIVTDAPVTLRPHPPSIRVISATEEKESQKSKRTWSGYARPGGFYCVATR